MKKKITDADTSIKGTILEDFLDFYKSNSLNENSLHSEYHMACLQYLKSVGFEFKKEFPTDYESAKAFFKEPENEGFENLCQVMKNLLEEHIGSSPTY